MAERDCSTCRHRFADDPCICLDCDPETLNYWDPELVHCRDCIHHNVETCHLHNISGMKDDDFCSRGEKE